MRSNSHGRERALAIWQTDSPNYLRLMQSDGKRYALGVTLSENGKRALVLYSDSYTIFDVDRGTSLADHKLDGKMMDVSADPSRLLVQGKDSTFEVLDAVRSRRIGPLLKLPSPLSEAGATRPRGDSGRGALGADAAWTLVDINLGLHGCSCRRPHFG